MSDSDEQHDSFIQRYSSKRWNKQYFCGTGYEDESDFYTKIVKKYFLKRVCFPRDLCKNCFFKLFDLLFWHLYKQTFRDLFKLLETRFENLILIFRYLHLECHNKVGGNGSIVYPQEKYFEYFSHLSGLMVNFLSELKQPTYTFDVDSFYAELLPYWSYCVSFRFANGLKEHKAWKPKSKFVDSASNTLRKATKYKKVYFQKTKEPLNFLKKWK